MALPCRIRRSLRIPGLGCLLLFVPLALAGGQPKPKAKANALHLLRRAVRQYSNLKSYKITEQVFTVTDGPTLGPLPSTTTAIQAPGGRYRYEADIGLGKVIKVSDGHSVWYFRPAQNPFRPWPERSGQHGVPEYVRTLDDMSIRGATGLDDMAWLASEFKSAKRLPDARLSLWGRQYECDVVQVTNKDRKVPLPYPFSDTIWIEKGALKIRKIVSIDVTTVVNPQSATTFPEVKTTLYPVVELNQPIPDSDFDVRPSASAELEPKSPPQIQAAAELRTKGKILPDVVLTSQDGAKLRLESLRGHPVLIDIWATWCAPCIDALPGLDRLYRQTRSTGMVFLSVDSEDDAKVAESYLTKMHYPWRNFHGDNATQGAFGMGGFPRTILINSDGKSVFDKVSPTLDELRAAIAKLESGHEQSAQNR